ncbi:MAG TPA: aldehyde ferredoxin oxidoreductase C-terminal domain-containing protein [Aggregatilineaceae bacterium]|nr:aldehyde ferredoxin oxidoreductase C-terminal domain-containing protein [Aggregatilineaceae bacterium]
MVYPVLQRELTVHLNNGHWYLRPTEDPSILGPVDFGWRRFNLYPDSFTFGEGLLAGSSIPGSRRLVFAAWSPQWESFYVSSMGGAAYTFHGVGVNYVALRGEAPTPSVLLLNHKAGEIQVRVEPIDAESIWTGYADAEGRPLIGFFALQQALYDRYAKEYTTDRVRVFCVGPASLYTKEGAIGSSPMRKGAFVPVEDWAGRGGLGSRLLQRHNIVGCVFGGEWEDPDLRDSKEIDAYFMEHFGKRTIQADLAVTTKYRYAPEFETGGTFGVNMRELGSRMMTFNYTSVYASEEEREKQHADFILQHYLMQFNDETIKTKNFQHCGEPCPVVCKKVNEHYKKDYEPYHALGPQIGVFDQRAAELINYHVDAMGFDAIEMGGTLAWIMEIVAEGLIDPAEYGLPPAEELKLKFTADVEKFDLVEDSLRNAKYAQAVVNALLFKPNAAVFRAGIRNAAREIDKQHGTDTINHAVFLANGDEGYMVPNQYWVPGMFSPMPIMGKYYVYYGQDFVPPRELGKKNVERMTYELFNDNTGICRFHRKWAESISDEILAAHYGIDPNYKVHQFELAREIYEHECAKAAPWESERVVDLMLGFLEQWERDALQNPELAAWLARFREDKMQAAHDFWAEIRAGIDEAFEAGADAIPEMLSPGQAGKL